MPRSDDKEASESLISTRSTYVLKYVCLSSRTVVLILRTV